VPADLRFYGDQGDLMEIVGNLADNACKWARSVVNVEVDCVDCGARRERLGLRIKVTDDGPGIPANRAEEAMRRGARLDQSVEGHGIGLATVREIVETGYSGQLELRSGSEGTIAEALLHF
jgi:two-component system sensor histidine kinase PhoQ